MEDLLGEKWINGKVRASHNNSPTARILPLSEHTSDWNHITEEFGARGKLGGHFYRTLSRAPNPLAYSTIVKLLENLPEQATLMITLAAHAGCHNTTRRPPTALARTKSNPFVAWCK
jgi:hypothetical protein